MDKFLLWYNLIFILSLIIGFIFIIGSSFDSSYETDHDIDHDSDYHGAFSILGFGKCPLTITLASMFLIFGGTGIAINIFLEPLLEISSAFAPLSIIPATFIMVAGTRMVTKTVAKLAPTTETESLKLNELVGASGTLALDSDENDGLGTFNYKGDVFQLRAITYGGLLKKGTQVIIIEYNESTNQCVVCKDPSIESKS